jgi:xanthine dehydrogenase accessory factor
MELLSSLLSRLQREACVLVEVQATAGSVPREVGTWMAVFAARLEDRSQDSDAMPDLIGTIGGGRLEFDAIREAQQRLTAAGPTQAAVLRYPLGPALGQCCGGVVHLRFTLIDASDSDGLARRLSANYRPVSLFGGGHVGGALARVLAPLPYRLTWIDSRDGVFPPDLPAGAHCEHSEPVQGAVASLTSGSAVLIMSFSHSEDLDVLIACLQRQRRRGDLPFIGLIGSRTKWATFSHRLAARGFTAEDLAQVRCPIGLPGIVGKEPEVIAVGVAAQLLREFPVAASTHAIAHRSLDNPSTGKLARHPSS